MRERHTDFRDFSVLADGDRVKLFPRPDNPLHKEPVTATYSGGYFYCDGSRPEDGPDYYLGDVLKHNEGWELADDPAAA